MVEKMICSMSPGEKLVYAIKNREIIKDHRPNSGKDFHGGYEELYLYKFKKFQSSVGKVLLDKKIREAPYNG